MGENAVEDAVATRLPGVHSTDEPVKPPTVDIVVPVLNEERALPGCVETLHAFLRDSFPLTWRITIADNGSTDATWDIARDLAARLPDVHATRIEVRGRGAALRHAWSRSPAEIVAYMDVDLSTHLDALLPMVAPLVSGHSEIGIGSRLARSSRVRRTARRELISRCYNLALRLSFGAGFRDAQCGFKAVRADVVRPLLQRVQDDAWFFDTELLLLAEHNGLRVHETPVDWFEDVDSRVNVVGTAWQDIRGMVRVARRMSAGHGRVDLPPRRELAPVHPDAVVAPATNPLLAKLVSFALIGVVSTIAHTSLYAALRTVWSPEWANLAALAVTAAANTEANRRWTFGRRGGARARVHSRAGLLFVVNYLFTTTVVVTAVHALPGHGRALEVAALLLAYVAMTIVRFAVLDRWVFRDRPAALTG
ncbi:glycosyltransferase [Spongiactinospora gelatinilytica]|uniref:glycosyltransferase n=1 Tax=Spongiactinospora gelatinilytica TaxID=2666298 RepID=UPI001F2BEAC9|nr:dolichyl-phosphate beta-glucosyltransferase [Spongiactinospora gelatinilytica]